MTADDNGVFLVSRPEIHWRPRVHRINRLAHLEEPSMSNARSDASVCATRGAARFADDASALASEVPQAA